ncbi:hypothetical protein IC229_30085 [Spirosoma sp. BT702]|uniref:Lipoprotein n=1 Tax=Spirosoma profusum TaxID=2771354 RepID=A0A927GA97_9BACT|nr:hypothetical protein [Spirosoma profusum]MBD2704920.1 hypothetical protein [Spirosoma profusum]
MKKIGPSMLLLMALLGCDKAPIKPEWTGWGDVNATRNGSKWTNTAVAALFVKTQLNGKCNGYIDLQFYKFSDSGDIRESLHISGISPQSPGRYGLVDEATSACGSGSALAGYQTNDDDVRISVYSFDQSQPNHLEITAYDSTTHRIEGTFRVTFNKQAAYTNNDPATVSFTGGKFSAPVNDKGRFE